ncbi:hypothetical protein JCM10296v2_000903 [Rhodotorula toruloides]
MASSREGHPAFDPVHAAAADNEKEKKKSLAATHAALAAWGGPEVLKPLISAAVNHWQASVCCFGHGLMEYETVYQDYTSRMPPTLDIQPDLNTERKDVHVRLWQPDAERYQVSGVTALSAVSPRKVVFNLTIEHAAVNPRPTLYLCLTFDLDYGQSGHSGALRSSTHAGHEVVARSLGVRTPRVLRRW